MHARTRAHPVFSKVRNVPILLFSNGNELFFHQIGLRRCPSEICLFAIKMAVIHVVRRSRAVSRVQVGRDLLGFGVPALAHIRVKQGGGLGERPAASAVFDASLALG